MEFAAAALNKVSVSDGSVFEGWGSVFGSLINSWMPTIIEPGAFRTTLRDHGATVKILYQHNTERPLGKVLDLKELPEGLFVRGRISDTEQGRDVKVLLKDGVLDGLSIGFDPGVAVQSKLDDGTEVRRLKTIKRLWEISLVTFPADEAAKITAVHARVLGAGRPADLAALQRLESWLGNLPDEPEDDFPWSLLV